MAELIPYVAQNPINNLAALQQAKATGDAATMNAATQAGQLDVQRGQLGVQQGQLALQQQEAVAAQKAAQDKIKLDALEYFLNVTTGVNSAEDLQIAKRMLNAKYPEHAAGLDKILPAYDPNSIRMIRNSMRTETQRMKEEELKGFSPGTTIYQGDTKIEQTSFAPTTPSKEEFELFTDSKGNQAYLKKGGEIPVGYSRVDKKTGSTVTVNTGDLGKGTRTNVEKEIIEGVKNIQSFQETTKKFKPEYLTYLGQAENKINQVMDKAGVAGKERQGRIKEYSEWFRGAKADFIAYRKWATGVAGGEKEMAEIATSFPDPVKNSPSQYKANLESIEETTKRVLQLNADFLKLGINMDQPLDKIMEEAKAAGLDVGSPLSNVGGGGSITIRFDAQGNVVE